MKLTTLFAGLILSSPLLFAAAPVVQTVPWVPGSPLVPHDTWEGRTITLKGACKPNSGSVHEYTWDFGDGTSTTGNVNLAKPWVIEATHSYSGPVGTVITARLTVTDTSTGESATTPYYIAIQDKTLQVEVNVAIDEGLWYIHKTQNRNATDAWWTGAGNYNSLTAINVNAFEANGHLEGGASSNPYTETVAMGMRWCLQRLASRSIGVQAGGNPDTNGNNLGIYVTQHPESYQNGIFIDVIVATGTPAKTASVGSTGIIDRSYFDIVQDMCDNYAWSQYDVETRGGWRYSPNQAPDNSACQWAAIGLIAAERRFGCSVPDWVKTRNANYLTFSQRADGVYGYTGTNPLSGVAFGTTPSGMVQCAMDGIGRGDPRWDKAATYMRDRWGNGGNRGTDPLINYYGLFAFVKAMQLHDSNGDGVAEPLKFLKSATDGVEDLEWYGAQVSMGDPENGVARTVVNDQGSNGAWPSKGWFDNHNLQTARAILMLNPDVLGSGNPVAVAAANPNPAVAGQTINLDGTGSFHGNPGNNLVKFEWDLDNDGTFDVEGPFASVSFPSVDDYPVTLRVTDDNSPAKTDDDIIVIRVNTPPLAPTADAGGPYAFCPEVPKWFLDGTRSINPDDGLSEPGHPGDSIVLYEWDLDGDGAFDDAFGPQPEVKDFPTFQSIGQHLIQLRVTDNTAASFPSSGQNDLSDVVSAVVDVKAKGECLCIDDLVARPKRSKVQLTWTDAVADHYNVYRSTVRRGPYTFIGSTSSTYSTYLDETVATGTNYYYVVRQANHLDQETCQSNEVETLPAERVLRQRDPDTLPIRPRSATRR